MGARRSRELIDSTLRFETPEGVLLELHPAGPAVRAVAFVVDFALRAAIYVVLAMVLLPTLGKLGMGVLLVSLFLVTWGYHVFFEVVCRGATPGKALMGLRVVHSDGTPVGWPASFVRNVLRAADMLPVTYGVGLVSALVQPGFRRLGDAAAGTLVVYADRPAPAVELPDGPARWLPVALLPEERRALVEYGARVNQLGPARAAEIARRLAPALESGADPESLKAMARWTQEQR